MPSVFILAMKKICFKHLSAHKALERQRGKHVEAEAEPCDVYDDVCIREIVENKIYLLFPTFVYVFFLLESRQM